jgi:hypothetical protein
MRTLFSRLTRAVYMIASVALADIAVADQLPPDATYRPLPTT